MARAGATAATVAATDLSSHAAVVQINLANNYINSLTGNHLSTDLTDRHPSQVALDYATYRNAPGAFFSAYVRVRGVTGYRFNAYGLLGSGFYRANAGSNYDRRYGYPSVSALWLVPVVFADSRYNAGIDTFGFLDVTARVDAAPSASVELTRLVFDNASTAAPSVDPGVTYTVIGTTTALSDGTGSFVPVPEPSTALTGLSLLALGAGGILTRRRQQRKAA